MILQLATPLNGTEASKAWADLVNTPSALDSLSVLPCCVGPGTHSDNWRIQKALTSAVISGSLVLTGPPAAFLGGRPPARIFRSCRVEIAISPVGNGPSTVTLGEIVLSDGDDEITLLAEQAPVVDGVCGVALRFSGDVEDATDLDVAAEEWTLTIPVVCEETAGDGLIVGVQVDSFVLQNQFSYFNPDA